MDIKIKNEYIKLQQILKLGGILSQGSDIKYYLAEEKIKVNGLLATQRGKKIYQGDFIEVEGFEKIKVL